MRLLKNKKIDPKRLNESDKNEIFKLCFDYESKNDAMRLFIGEIYFLEKKFDEAFKWSLPLAEKEDLTAMCQLGRIYYHQKEYRNASFWYEKYLLIDKSEADLYWNFGLLFDSPWEGYNRWKSAENYARAYLLYDEKKREIDKEHCFLKLERLFPKMNIDQVLETFRKSIEFEHLKKENERLGDEVRYRPGGEGAVMAEADFNDLVKKN